MLCPKMQVVKEDCHFWLIYYHSHKLSGARRAAESIPAFATLSSHFLVTSAVVAENRGCSDSPSFAHLAFPHHQLPLTLTNTISLLLCRAPSSTACLSHQPVTCSWQGWPCLIFSSSEPAWQGLAVWTGTPDSEFMKTKQHSSHMVISH